MEQMPASVYGQRISFPDKMTRFLGIMLVHKYIVCICISMLFAVPPSVAATVNKHKNEAIPWESAPSLTDLHSTKLSDDALQLADQLGIREKLEEVSAVKALRKSNSPVPPDRLERYRDYREDVVDAIEESLTLTSREANEIRDMVYGALHQGDRMELANS